MAQPFFETLLEYIDQREFKYNDILSLRRFYTDIHKTNVNLRFFE